MDNIMNNKPITDKIIQLWLNGCKIDRIAELLDCTIELVNQTVEREIYHNNNDKKNEVKK